MTQQKTLFNISICAKPMAICTALAAIIIALNTSANAAGVVSRGSASTSRPTVSRANNAASRMPTITAAVSATSTPNTPNPEPTPVPEQNPTPTTVTTPPAEEPTIIENKTAQFDTGLTKASTSSAQDANANSLAEMVRRQRAALDAQSASDAANADAAASLASGQSACDIGLRECMKQKCGNDYSKCAGDGDTTWGDKMDTCRRTVTCTGRQYTMFAKEIKADRDMNAKLSSYNKIINCGNEYNECIVTQCGENYSKCLGKTAGDAAISKCATVAKNCTQQDSGLASRTMNVFATLRQDAEKQIVKDEQRLYEMRDKMRSQCQRFGAMFDERSLVCVYTVNFYAGNATTPTASKKAYAGSTFDCTQDWFGIDVTTFKENAYRYTRSQTGATSSLMGSGLGIGVGALTSGAIDRAVDRHKAEKAVKDAEKEKKEYFDKDSDDKSDVQPEDKKQDKDKAEDKADNDADNKDTAPETNANNDADNKDSAKKDNPTQDADKDATTSESDTSTSKQPTSDSSNQADTTSNSNNKPDKATAPDNTPDK